MIPQAFPLVALDEVSKRLREREEIEAFIPPSACDAYFSLSTYNLKIPTVEM